MTKSELVVRVLMRGTVGALALIAVAFLLSRFASDIVGRSLLAICLFIAAGAYFGFAIGAGARPIWTLIETAQCVIFGTMALLGLRGSVWWLFGGWALHPVWDVVLHYVGPGQSFTPWKYAVACFSFDLVVAAYIGIVYGLRLL